MKEIMITGVRPTGNFTLGNYIGAMRNFVNLQSKYDSYIFIADIHALTDYQNPQEMKERILDFAAMYLACGVNPKHTKMFIQSDVFDHTLLGYLLSFQCKVGELSRMTQYKSKKEKIGKEGVGFGLLAYPTLMASDILLYDAKVVPVGLDQKQHIEYTRDIGEKFNKLYGETFKLPDYYIGKIGSKIMNLTNPLEKMSKSSPITDKGTIFILDDTETIKSKIMSATTDDDKLIKYDEENKPGISNLLTIYSVVSNIEIKDLEIKYQNKTYKEFKEDLASEISKFLKPIQERFYKYRNSKELLDILKIGKLSATTLASKKITEVKEKLGLNYNNFE